MTFSQNPRGSKTTAAMRQFNKRHRGITHLSDCGIAPVSFCSKGGGNISKYRSTHPGNDRNTRSPMIHSELHRLDRTRSATHDNNLLPPHIDAIQLTRMASLPTEISHSRNIRNRNPPTSPNRNNNPIENPILLPIPNNNPPPPLHLPQPTNKTPKNTPLPQPIALPQPARLPQNLVSPRELAAPINVRVEFVELGGDLQARIAVLTRPDPAYG